MALRSVYIPSAVFDDGRIRITDEEHHHLAVARVEQGEEIEVFDGKGNVWLVTVELHGRRETLAAIRSARTIAAEACELTLGLALIKSSAFELALEKAVEIGVTHIVPFIAARSNVAPPKKSDKSKTPDRWTRIIVEAAKQSKRYRLPAIEGCARFNEVVRMSAASKILFAEHSGGPLHSALAGAPVLYLVGPEGGWTDSELNLAQENGFKLVTLGTGILKAETAAIVGGALIRHELRV